ncbi:MAG: DUF2911 domain-containing protein [Cyclobacteriaceae bacterium]
MKNLLTITLMILIGCGSPEKKTEEMDHSEHANHEAASTDGDGEKKKAKSPKQMAMANVGDNHVHIEYSSPGKRGRQIFGGLVAFGEVWVTGAHRATSINFGTDVKIGGTTIPAGKYALFTIPGEEEWTIIINKNWDQHLADDYDQADDLVRVSSVVQKPEETVESLTYTVEQIDETMGMITISWDDVAVGFEIENI